MLATWSKGTAVIRAELAGIRIFFGIEEPTLGHRQAHQALVRRVKEVVVVLIAEAVGVKDIVVEGGTSVDFCLPGMPPARAPIHSAEESIVEARFVARLPASTRRVRGNCHCLSASPAGCQEVLRPSFRSFPAPILNVFPYSCRPSLELHKSVSRL